MATTISFTNYNNEALSKQQVNSLSEYLKVYKVNDVVKKIDYYYNGKLEGIEYFKDDNENLNDVFTSLGTNTLTITHKEIINSHIAKISTSYNNGIISYTEKELSIDNKIICVHELDSNNELKTDDCVKYLYNDDDEENIARFIFHYNPDGTLKYIGGIDYPFSEYNQFLESGEIHLFFPNLLTDNPYYANINFLP